MMKPSELDRQFGWNTGTARKLAEKGRLPHVLLPDGSIRFEMDQILPLVKRCSPTTEASAAIASAAAKWAAEHQSSVSEFLASGPTRSNFERHKISLVVRTDRQAFWNEVARIHSQSIASQQ